MAWVPARQLDVERWPEVAEAGGASLIFSAVAVKQERRSVAFSSPEKTTGAVAFWTEHHCHLVSLVVQSGGPGRPGSPTIEDHRKTKPFSSPVIKALPGSIEERQSCSIGW